MTSKSHISLNIIIYRVYIYETFYYQYFYWVGPLLLKDRGVITYSANFVELRCPCLKNGGNVIVRCFVNTNPELVHNTQHNICHITFGITTIVILSIITLRIECLLLLHYSYAVIYI
jgi:hypothetical protein